MATTQPVSLTIVTPASRSAPPVQLKGRLYTLTSVQILSDNLAHIRACLSEKKAKNPIFFQKTPVVIQIKTAETLDLLALEACLREHELVPVGLSSTHEQHKQAAHAIGWAVLADDNAEPVGQASAPAAPKTPTKLVTEPVRSGQQIYARGGDLIITAPVSHGAEILADGHIHVYAPLRGRALAGILGDETARIFCSRLEAELVSVAGHYLVSEQLKQQGWEQAVQIQYTGTHLHILQL